MPLRLQGFQLELTKLTRSLRFFACLFDTHIYTEVCTVITNVLPGLLYNLLSIDDKNPSTTITSTMVQLVH